MNSGYVGIFTSGHSVIRIEQEIMHTKMYKGFTIFLVDVLQVKKTRQFYLQGRF